MSCTNDIVFEEYMNDEASPLEMRRLIDQENKQILPYKEEIEVINLGNNEEKKEVKVGTTLLVEMKKEIIDLLRELADVFAWSYQDMLIILIIYYQMQNGNFIHLYKNLGLTRKFLNF